MREFANGLWYCLALLLMTMPVAAQNQKRRCEALDGSGRGVV
jgi:hypothetical protein